MKTTPNLVFASLISSLILFTGCASTPRVAKQLERMNREHTLAMAALKNRAEMEKFARENGIALPPISTPSTTVAVGPPVFRYEGGWINGMENWFGRNSSSFGYYPRGVIVRQHTIGAGVYGAGCFTSGGSFSYRP